MKLFGGKEAKPTCACGRTASRKDTGADTPVLILGCGCGKSRQLEAAVRAALEGMESDAALGLVTDAAQIAAYGVMTTPALVIHGRVVSSGKLLKVEEAARLLRENLSQTS
nr:thioredoxin family protein [uncultured Oscillibacter sp.]